ncbi:MAG: aminopeptidase [Pirellulales bacterium]
MRDPRLDRLATVLVEHCAPVRPGDLVTIVSDPAAMPAVEAVFEAVLRSGGHPSFHPKSDRLHELLLKHGSDEQLQHVSPFEAHRLAACDVLMVLRYQSNTRYLGQIDSKRIARNQSARRELMAKSMQRAADGKMRWVLTDLPSDASAQDAGMSLANYEDWVFRAGWLHLADPVAAWRKLHDAHGRAIEFLAKKSILRFTAPAIDGQHDGTDLVVDVAGRTWVSCAAGENFPDGEIFTGPRGVDGVVNFSFPAVYAGKEVDGIRLAFRDGRVIEASATKNEAHLIELLDQDAGARTVGEIAIGTNYEIKDSVRNAFYDEKIGGTFHLAVGAGYPETGNTNQSGLHWDLVTDLRNGGAIYADGELILQDGRFTHPDWPQPHDAI